MWRPWSEPHTLALTANSAALRSPGGVTRTLLELGGDIHGTPVMDALIQALAAETATLAQQRVRIILSNHFIRYSVLPWQEGVSRRADWQALAAHDLRQRYGPVADGWEIRVNLGRYGHPVLCMAMDSALFSALQQLAAQQHWQIAAMQPLLLPLLRGLSAAESRDPHWLLMAEPGRVVLGEMEAGQYRRFSVISPPAGEEQDSAEQLVARSLLRYVPEQHPRQILAAITAPLANAWRDGHGKFTSLRLADASHHAEWLAAL